MICLMSEFGMSRREHGTSTSFHKIRDRHNAQSTQLGPRLRSRRDGRAPQLREGDTAPPPARPGRSTQTHQMSVDKECRRFLVNIQRPRWDGRRHGRLER